KGFRHPEVLQLRQQVLWVRPEPGSTTGVKRRSTRANGILFFLVLLQKFPPKGCLLTVRKTPHRVTYLDWMRGLGVLIMLQGHVLDAWVRPQDRVGEW